MGKARCSWQTENCAVNARGDIDVSVCHRCGTHWTSSAVSYCYFDGKRLLPGKRPKFGAALCAAAGGCMGDSLPRICVRRSRHRQICHAPEGAAEIPAKLGATVAGERGSQPWLTPPA